MGALSGPRNRKFPRREHSRAVLWIALSPEYETNHGYYEPPETGRDFLYVYARSAHRAKVLAIRAWRRGWWKGCRTRRTITSQQPYIVRYHDENPMRAVTVERQRLDLDA